MIVPKTSPLPAISTAGAMYEINMLIWPAIYGVTGHALGSVFGLGWLGAIVGVVLGYVTGAVMMRMLFYDVEILAPLVFVPIMILVPAPARLWLMGAVSISPWVRMIPRAVAGRTKAAAHTKEIAACMSADGLLPFLEDDAHQVFRAAGDRLYALGLTHDEIVRVILRHAAGLSSADLIYPERRRWLCHLVQPLAEAGTDARDPLLELYANFGWLRDASGPADQNADRLIEEVLFERLAWEDDGPLMQVTERRLSQGWNVDAMVDRLLASDAEAGCALAERAFPAGSLSPDRLNALGDERGVLAHCGRAAD
ncbi:MAG: hypothetical protein BMS9Abin29_0797 [Gemmatimonadota bacterium]|nr:MAG: hypothetical protein BMS9Abin29_0797 [Gemmatimonadota bacterium]